ncbi:MAG: cytochrome c-type biogenesis protein CcmH [Anaerolineae bacterium]
MGTDQRTQRNIVWRRFVALGLALMIWGVASGPLWAQTPTPNQINAVAKELWCPLCNGVRLDNCELQACIQMKEVIAQKLMAGESKEQIKAYFVQQYGDVVLGAPSSEGFNLLAWLLPVLIVLVAIGWLIFLVRIWTRRRAPAGATSPAAPAASAAAQGDYLKRVEEELRQYE